MTTGSWAAVADAVARRRAALGYSSQKAFAEAHPFSERTVSAIESHERNSYARTTISHLERALRWAPGSVDRILAGGEPVELSKPVDDAPGPEDVGPTLRAATKWELLAELARRLEEGGQRQDRPGQAVLDPNSLDPEIAEALGVDQDDTQQRRRA